MSVIILKMEKALANMALRTAEAACAKEEEPPTPKEAASPAATPSALKGVSQSLLERVRTGHLKKKKKNVKSQR